MRVVYDNRVIATDRLQRRPVRNGGHVYAVRHPPAASGWDPYYSTGKGVDMKPPRHLLTRGRADSAWGEWLLIGGVK